MLKKIIITISIITLSILIYLPFSKGDKVASKNGYFYSFTDSKGREINLNQEPKSIVSLAPSITETIYFLDGFSRLVGRTDYCDYPNKVVDVESIGTLRNPNIEKIIELNPDLIIASSHFDFEVLNKLEEAGLTTVILQEERQFDGVYTNISTISKIINSDKKGKKLISKMKTRVSDVINKVKNLNRPSVYYVVGFGEYGDYTAGGDTFISDIIEYAGGVNAAKDLSGWSYTLEKIVESNPDIFICSKYNNTLEGIVNATGYKELDGIKKGNIYAIDNNRVDRQGPRIVDGLEEIAKIIHPDVF